MKHSKLYFVFLLVIMSGLKVYGYKNYDIKVKNDEGVTIYYNFINDNKELSVTFCGDYDSYYGWKFDKVYEGYVKIPNEVEVSSQKLKVTSIGRWAFRNCKYVSLSLPDNLKKIESLAFDNAIIDALYITDFKVWCNMDCTDVNPFINAEKVFVNGTEFVLGANITIPDGLDHIGSRAFANSRILSVKIPNSVSQIGERAFGDCERLMEVNLGDSIARINNSAFRNCTALESIVLPETIEYIGLESFYGCNNLKSINLPSSINDIGDGAFERCYNLSCPIEIPDSIYIIKENTFAHCEKIPSIKFGNSLEKIDKRSFHSCKKLSIIELPTSLKEIGERAFACCHELSKIELPTSLKEIGEGAFVECINISSIDIPRNVSTIESLAFYGCSKLSSIKLCGSVKKIGSYAFKELNYEKIFISCSEDPYDADDEAFDTSGHNTKLLVPLGTKKIYEVTKGWKKFSIIEESELASGFNDIKTINEVETYYKLNGAVTKSDTRRGIVIERYNNGRTRKILKP